MKKMKEYHSTTHDVIDEQLAWLSKKNVAVVIQDFASRPIPSELDYSTIRAIIRSLDESEKRCVLVIVYAFPRAHRIKNLLTNFTKQFDVSISAKIAGDSFVHLLGRNNVVIVRASVVLEALEDNVFNWEHVQLVVFDEAQKATQQYGEGFVIVHDHYIPRLFTDSPRILAVLNESENVEFDSIAHNLHVEFPPLKFRPRPSRVQQLEECEAQFYYFADNNEEECTTSDHALLNAELGPGAAILYRDWFNRQRDEEDGNNNSFVLCQPRLLLGLSHKTATFLGIIGEEYKRVKNKLTVAVYTQFPVVALTLRQLLCSIPRFKRLITCVLLENCYTARSLENDTDTIRVQNKDAGEVVNEFASGCINITIMLASSLQTTLECATFPPSPLVVDFDGAAFNSYFRTKTKIGGRVPSRIVVFQTR